jgi:hypothetical protein
MERQSWKVSFKAGDSFKDRSRAHQGGTARPVLSPQLSPKSAPAQPARSHQEPAAPQPPEIADDGTRGCARQEWCEERTVAIENGTRTVVPARTYMPYCIGCTAHIGKCLDDRENGLPQLYRRLAAEIGEARQAEVMVKMPFGPSVPLSEAIDAHMRSMTETMCGWEERVREMDHLSGLGEKNRHPQDDVEDLDRSVGIIIERVSILLALAKQEMLRFLAWWAVPDDAHILTGDGFMVKAIVRFDGEDAGREIMHLHYFARRLLLETNPPMPLLPDFRCRACELKALRRAAPPWHQDSVWYWSRCDNCGDECSREEYDVNAKRWVAYEKAHLARPVLGEMTQVA